MKFARWTFGVAGVYGFLILFIHYFLEARIGRELPPAVTHPEFFYGFIGVGLAWQVLFLLIAGDPARLRPAMIPSVLEKFLFAGAVFILYAQGRVAALVLRAAATDVVFGALFIAAFVKTREPA